MSSVIRKELCMNIAKKIRTKWNWHKRKRQWKKERFDILKVSDHTYEYVHPEYIHTAICETDRPVKDYEFLAILVSGKVGFDTTGYSFYGVNSIIFLAENKYQISWNTWHTCD